MTLALKRRLGQLALVTLSVAGLVAASDPEPVSAQPRAAEAGSGAYRLLQGAIDTHFHIDPDTETGSVDAADIAKMRFAKAQGIRGFVIKNHRESTASVAYLIRKEIPGIEVFGSVVLNRNQGGLNPAIVEYLASGIKGRPGRIVWMPTTDSENSVKRSKQPNRPFVRISQNGELVPEARQVLEVIAKHDLVLATGHIAPAESLLVLREARRLGVKRMIVTHPMLPEASVDMNEAQMKEAMKLGAFLEFDFRNVLTGKIASPFQTAPVAGGRVEMIRRLGPESVIINEFWSRSVNEPREYGGPAELAAWVKAMNEQGFTNRELDLMCKENPAKLLGLSVR